MSMYGPLAGWEIFGSYVGFFLMGSSFIAVGLFISALTENQLIAAIITFVALLLSYLMDGLMQIVPTGNAAGIVFVALAVLALAGLFYTATRNLYIGLFVLLLGGGAIGLTAGLNADLFNGLIVRSCPGFPCFPGTMILRWAYSA